MVDLGAMEGDIEVRNALRRINHHGGEPWLGESRIEKVLHDLERFTTPNRTEANQKAMCLLRKGVVGDGDP